MRILAIIAVGVVFARAAQSQIAGGIDGRVVDEHGRPIAGARVELTPGARRIVGDENGQFRFRNVAPGAYTIAVQRIGYVASELRVEVPSIGTKVVVTLVSIPQVLDSVRIRERKFKMRYSALVLDDRGVPIPDVAVVIAGIDNSLHTDSAGRFSLPKQLHFGTAVMVRMRKIGYAAFFETKSFYEMRDDTLRMKRLSQGLSAVEITERSGFGRDTFVYKDLDQRTRWRPNGAGAMSREFLATYGTINLCVIWTCSTPTCIILNGEGRTFMPLNAFYVDELELVEIYPPKTDWSGNLAARGCPDSSPNTRPAGSKITFVIWTRRDSLPKP